MLGAGLVLCALMFMGVPGARFICWLICVLGVTVVVAPGLVIGLLEALA